MIVGRERVSEDFRFRANYYYLLSKLLSESPTDDTISSVALFGVPNADANNSFLITLNNLAEAARAPSPTLNLLMMSITIFLSVWGTG